MIRRLHSRSWRCAVLCALFVATCALVGLQSTASAMLDAVPSPSLALVPVTAQLRPGEATRVDVLVSNVTDLYAYQITIDYNATILRVADADGNGANGIQARLGSFVHPDMVVVNRVDEAAGKIRVVVTQLNPSEPVSGAGQLFSFEVVALASGTAVLHVAPYPTNMLTNRDAEPFALTLSDARIEVVLGEAGPYGLYLPLVRGRAAAR
jgi:hypothetical protein